MSAPARRFYAKASATPERCVALDARQLRTPGGVVFTAPTAALAEAVAAEWEAQGEHLAPASMPLTQLAFAAIDWTPQSRDRLADYVAAFAETDLCCHRAHSPADLTARQEAHWGALIVWAAEAHGVKLRAVSGVIAATENAAARETVRAHAAGLDDFRLTALAQAAGLSGSALIALAMLAGRLDAASAFAAAALDPLWSLEKWGEDEEARAKLDRQAQEFDNIARFLAALNTGSP